MDNAERAKALFFRAQDSRKAGRDAEAEALLREAMALEPTRTSIRINLCGALIDQGKHAEALPFCQTLVSEEPERAVCWHRLSLCEAATGADSEALSSIERCLALEPENREAIYHALPLLLKRNDTDAALQLAQRVVALTPQDAAGHTALGVVHTARREFALTLAAHQRAVALAPQDADKRWNLALVQLMLGDFVEGWRSMEARWRMTDAVAILYHGSAPRWDGRTSLSGKHIVLWGEQGLGDCIQFARFIPPLLKTGAKVSLQVPDELNVLMKASLPGVTVLQKGSFLPPHDCQLPLISLPGCFDAAQPLPAPLPLHVPDQLTARWRARRGDGGPPRVGLMWQGNPDNLRGRHRSLPVDQLAALFALPLEFHCVSNVIASEDAAWIRTHAPELRIHTRDLTDFAETAALLQTLDLLVTIDTSIAHLGPSVGVETWTLLSWEADWRWMTSDATPWYPQSQLFRQLQRGEWQAPVSALHAALSKRFPGA